MSTVVACNIICVPKESDNISEKNSDNLQEGRGQTQSANASAPSLTKENTFEYNERQCMKLHIYL